MTVRIVLRERPCVCANWSAVPTASLTFNNAGGLLSIPSAGFPAGGDVQTAQQLGEDGLYRALNLLVEVDHQSKSGVGDAAENVERFLLVVGQTLSAPLKR